MECIRKYILLIFVILSQQGFGQNWDFPDFLNIDYFNGQICFDSGFDGEDGTLTLILDNGKIITIEVWTETQGFGCSIGEVDLCCAQSGTFYYSNIDIDVIIFSCEGEFEVEYETEPNQLRFANDCMLTPTGDITANDCAAIFNIDWDYQSHFVCIGDTIHVDILDDGGNFPPSGIFIPSMIEMSNGHIVSYTDYSFDVVWDNLGDDCLIFNTGGECGIDQLTHVVVEPKEQLQIIADGTNTNQIEICVDEEVSLTSATPSENIEWIVSSGIFSQDNELDLSFSSPGNYTVVLNKGSDCNCSLPDTLQVSVLSGAIPGIDCTGTICSGSVATYYSEQECDTYLWTTSSNGTIIDGGGPTDFFITVQWNSGSTGELTLSTPGCNANNCKDTVTEIIPIISATAAISGPTTACYGSYQNYSIPNYQGSDILWSIDWQDGRIESGYGTNEITVHWSDGGNPIKTISVTYENCNLECSGMATLDVVMVEDIFIELDQYQYCEKANLTLSNTQSKAVDWILTYPDFTTQTISNQTILNTTLTQIGRYKILLDDVSGTSCNLRDSVFINIFSPPNVPSEIIGPTNICKGEFVSYTIPDLDQYQNVYWDVYDGSTATPTSSSTSLTLTHAWMTDGPYQITAHIVDALSGCESESLTVVLEENLEIIGDDLICINEISSYTLDNYTNGEIVWRIDPDAAGEILSRDGDMVEIVWLEYGIHLVVANYCNFEKTISVDVPNESMSILWEPPCFEQTTPLEILRPTGSTFTVWDSLRNVIAIEDTAIVRQGEYVIQVITENGCELRDTVEIIERSKIGIVMSASSNNYCPTDPDIIFNCTDLGPGSNYDWYIDGVLFSSTTTPSTTNNSPGVYSVSGINMYGCRVNDFTLVVSCCGPTIEKVLSLNLNTDRLDCYDYRFEILPVFQSTDFTWKINDSPIEADNADGTLLNYTFPRAGCYRIEVMGNYYELLNQLECGNVFLDTVYESAKTFVCFGVSPNFHFDDNCENQTIDFEFDPYYFDLSTTFSHEYDFGDPASGFDNTSTDFNPTHIYNSPGEYIITLSMTDLNDGCVYQRQKTITISDYPAIDITHSLDPCERGNVIFEAITSDPNLRYDWDFGDPTSTLPNTANLQSVSHLYLSDGTYTVTLTALNPYSCKTVITKDIIVDIPSFSGEIISNTTYPKCEGQEAILTAPTGGSNYLWSTNDNTQQITVTDPGSYTVTITYGDGCQYEPLPHYVYDFTLGDAVIRGIKHNPKIGESNYHYDTLTVCLGDPFDVEVTEIPNVNYDWHPLSSSNRVLTYAPHFNSRPPGIYELEVDIYSDSGCNVTVPQFVIEILDEVAPPIIQANDTIPCEEDYVILTVTNIDPDLTYEWSTGVTGTEIVGVSRGYYTVSATNSMGCSVESDGIFVNRNPSFNSWLSGCYEVCFPDTLCLRLNPSQDYTLVRNETELTPISSSTTELPISTPGDYQLIVTSSSGCTGLSDILTLDAKPEDHELSGIVYLDENENGIFDGIDMLLEDIPVTLYNGNTAVDATLTDISGAYLFDSLQYSNLIAEIDPSGTGYTLSGNLDSILLYVNCNENKIINFPLIPDCRSLMLDTTYMVCASGSIEIEGITYYPNDTDTLRYPVSMNCDSVVAFNVLASPEPQIILTIDSTCVGENNGTVNIENVLGANLNYSLDTDPTLFTDDMIDGLSTGLHTLYVHDDNGCNSPLSFMVPELPGAEIMITPFATCLLESNGYITIDIINGESLSFALDGSIDYVSDVQLENLDVGNHILHIIDDNGCEYEEAFTIPLSNDPTITTSTEGICSGTQTGNVFITIVSGENLLFSLSESGPYVSDTFFDGLAAGDYLIYIQDETNCTHSAEFEIVAYPEIEYSLFPSIICAEEMYGSLQITNQSDGLTFSLDGIEYLETDMLDSITSGLHPLYILDEYGCADTIEFNIQQIDFDDITYNITNGCENINGGIIAIDSIWIGLSFAIDNQEFQENLVYDQLAIGDHILYVDGPEGCVKEIPFTIIDNPEPQIEIQTQNTCFATDNGSITISTIDGAGMTYSLDGNIFTKDISFDSLTIAIDTLYAQTIEGCIYEYPFIVEAYPELSVQLSSINSCNGESNGSIIIADISTLSAMYLNDEEIEMTDSINDLTEGFYILNIVDENGCQLIDTLSIETLPPLQVEVPSFDPDCLPTSLVLSPDIINHNGSLEYEWSNGSSSESVIINESGIIEVLIRDECSEYKHSWDLTFDINITSDLIHVPNVFSPNQDGINDCFISTLDPRVDLLSYNQLIFDRWGNLMFTSDDINRCWDGTFQGGDVVTGVFVYITDMVVNHCDGIQDVRKVGDVTVIR